MKIICVGHAAWDITIPVDRFPIENTKNRYDNVVECGGGPAASASYLLGKWGMNPYFIGTVGNDIYGKDIIDSLKKVSVNTDYVKVSGEPTTRGLILANKEKGSRTILTYQNGNICSKEAFLLPFSPDIMLFDGQEYVISKTFLENYPNCISIMDAGRATPTNIELAKLATYVVCSKEFAEAVSNEKFDFKNYESLVSIYKKVKEQISGTLVITIGKYGSIYENDGDIIVMPSLQMKAIDSTGAGDIFHGAFVYGIANKLQLEEIIKISTVAAGLSVQYVGVQNSIVSLEQLREKLYEIK